MPEKTKTVCDLTSRKFNSCGNSNAGIQKSEHMNRPICLLPVDMPEGERHLPCRKGRMEFHMQSAERWASM
ncbi:MAG: hypothetical protein ACD_75C01963G0001 [uncultured bacterium]|nr:MAG: hypothetical protein ACD_75C01963G0001 [uncultured bacterium]